MAISKVQATINGTTHSLSLNSSTGYYEASVTAPTTTSYNNNSGHYFPVTVKATDSAGNVTQVTDSDATFGDILKLRVKETVAPVISITSPTDGELTTNTKPTVVWTVTDSGSGINSSSIGITIDSGSKVTSGITKTAITNGYSCSYTIPSALSDGTHTVEINASDNDGNAATQRSVSFVVDAAPPVLSVSSPTNNLVTNNKSVTVSGKTSDVTSGIKKVTVKLNSGAESSITVDSSGNFSTTITLAEGANTIVITSYDAGGLKTSVTRVVTLDTQAPVISDITLTPNPVSTGELLTINVKVTD